MIKKRGAPKKPPGEVKTGTIQVRVTDGEREAIESAATSQGTTVSKWACDVLMRAAKRATKR
ncbi:MAG: DUF1778 domain-containing protein [Planctomycetaceae bacterium]|nr:DUF1778 domain-containing protein [Planctomycetales bacterium]MCB9924690.1 DUF1778 domain-containing protein [Planctomycetaceae bacterium]